MGGPSWWLLDQKDDETIGSNVGMLQSVYEARGRTTTATPLRPLDLSPLRYFSKSRGVRRDRTELRTPIAHPLENASTSLAVSCFPTLEPAHPLSSSSFSSTRLDAAQDKMISPTLRQASLSARSNLRAFSSSSAVPQLSRTLTSPWQGTRVDGGNTLNLIGGEWTAGTTEKWIDLRDPSTQNLLTRVPETSLADLDRAAAKAEEAFDEWKDSSILKRQAVMLKYVLRLPADLSLRSFSGQLIVFFPQVSSVDSPTPRRIGDLYRS